MSIVVQTTNGGMCTICRTVIDPGGEGYTHEGVTHDPFHRQCWSSWIVTNPNLPPTCPLCREVIEPSSLVSRTERIMARLRPALVNAAYAASFGLIIGAAGIHPVAAVATGAVAAAGVGAVAAVAGAGVGAVAAVAAGAGAAGALITGGVAAGVAVGAGVGAAVAKAAGALATGAVEVAGVAVATTATVAGFGIDLILDRRGFNPIARMNIGIGISAGGMVCLIAATTDNLSRPLTAIATISLIGSAVAGILSLVIRR